CLQSKNSPYNF
nr:immunoglobulin light chain junction region [Macaca mulatta]MOX56827.1 immunoglobulin light chain junction region [Macaca mulatta]